MGQFRIDGEFIIRNGYLQREFGNSALLHLPQAENFDLEGVIQLDGPGGWLMLLGWDIDSKSGYAVYNTQSKVSWSRWYVVEIKDGKAVTNSEKMLVDKRVDGEGALRMSVENKNFFLQVAGAYVLRDQELPNYKEGHVAIGTFSPNYGPRNFGVKSLRMKLR